MQTWQISALIAALIAFAAAEASRASPPDAPDPATTVSPLSVVRPAHPDWLRKPTGADIGAVYPEHAQRMRISGRTVMSCAVDGAGLLINCQIVSEAPPNEGFGKATLLLAHRFKMSNLTPDGHSVAGATVNIPIRFQIAQ